MHMGTHRFAKGNHNNLTCFKREGYNIFNKDHFVFSTLQNYINKLSKVKKWGKKNSHYLAITRGTRKNEKERDFSKRKKRC